MDKKKSSKNTGYLVVGFLFFVSITIAMILLSLNFFGAKETYISAEDDTTSIDSLYCSANKLEKPFFEVDGAESVLHEIKVTFRGNEPDLISYKITGVFSDTKLAKKQGDLMLSKLWTYLQDYGFAYNYVENSHSTVDNTASIDVVANSEKLNNVTAPIFGMEKIEALKFKEQTMESLGKLYMDKGFNCKNN